ncbi:MAG TPA: hypothetical protein PKL04_01100 [Methanofastidiosum sp.]|nr:hypothetical protein [Methanofastidiosum sp.]
MKDNTSIGIDPNDDTAAIMAEIDKNIQEEQEAGTFGKDVDKKDYVDPRIDGLENLEDLEQANIADEEVEIEKKETKKEAKEEEKEEEPSDADLFREKYYQEKKKRKGVYADRQKLEQENEELKKYLQNTISSNAELYKNNLISDLEKIKGLRKQALLGEDPDLLIEADDLYYKALMKLNEFEANRGKFVQDEPEEEVETKEIPENAKQLDDEVLDNAKEWLNNRPELIEGSKEYNPRIQKALATFIEEFDGELRRQGRAQDILSEDYLDVLDEFVDSIRVEKPKSGYKTSSVGAVRNNFSSNSGGGNTIQVKLESWEKDYAKNLGISERDYLKAKIEDIKETRRGR